MTRNIRAFINATLGSIGQVRNDSGEKVWSGRDHAPSYGGSTPTTKPPHGSEGKHYAGPTWDQVRQKTKRSIVEGFVFESGGWWEARIFKDGVDVSSKTYRVQSAKNRGEAARSAEQEARSMQDDIDHKWSGKAHDAYFKETNKAANWR